MTTEYYFQAQKFAGTEHEEAVRLRKTPRQAADMGRSRKLPLRRDWESVKDQVMPQVRS
jgi:N-glycosidase YbiA